MKKYLSVLLTVFVFVSALPARDLQQEVLYD